MVLAVDTETTGLGYFDTPFCVTMAWRDGGELFTRYFDIDELTTVFTWLCSAEELVFHNAKFDVQKLELVGIPIWEHKTPYQIHDTECLSHLLNEQRPKRLKGLAKELLGEETDEAQVLAAVRRKLKLRKSDGFDALPREVLEPYALKDAEFTLRLFELLYPQLDEELLRLYKEDQELMVVLYDMEQAGIGLDLEYLRETAKEYAGKILTLDLKIRDMVGVEDFNPNSWQQIQAAFRDRGIDLVSTKKEVLVSLGDELAESILALRSAKKTHGTYLKNMLAEQRDGIIHPNFKQFGTKGRRFSSGSSEMD